ncbi:hypothetical protein JHN59_13910 [Streptomyces sp. MBT49]|uniref:hypothetical protein n=1 Tax=Streptomyces sp. MBT49 TaxID=1488380 RepID=UPI00190AEB61|nr:hypothetical protein [Streptomyces sp. MBT49]MBK3625919.1 hypothetical protein [Streptomyces sp. MBT49]
MKIRMLTEQPEGAVLNGDPWPAVGEEADVPTAQAAHLIASGVAEEAGDEDDDQAAAAPRRRRKAADPGGDAT